MSKHPLADCGNCPLRSRDMVPSVGPKDAKVAFVSRSPGRYDAERGKPFGGPPGKVLDHLLELNGYRRSDVLTTNIVLCETTEVPKEAIACCRPRLEQELSTASVIIAAGSEAVTELTSLRSVSSARLTEIERTTADGLKQRVVATTNPAIVMRESGNFPDMVRDFKFALSPVKDAVLPEVVILDDPGGALNFLDFLMDYDGLVASDLETFLFSENIACAGFAVSPTKAYVLSYNAVMNDRVRSHMREVYENPKLRWLWHNGKYDIKVLWQNGIKARIDEDTFLLSYALDERPGGDYQGDQGSGLHALTKTLVEEYGWPDYEPDSVKQFKKTGVLPDDPTDLYIYNGYDTAGTMLVYGDYGGKAQADNVLEKPYKTVSVPLANALVDVELRGFAFSTETAADLNEREVLPRLRGFIAEMQEVTGLGLFNPRSPKQVVAVVYDTWGLKHELRDTYKKKKTGSVDASVRKEVTDGRFECKTGYRDRLIKFVELYEIFQKIDKQRGTYIEGLIDKVSEDGRLYSTFKFGTVSGRTSSERPNFQNITRSGSNGIPSIRSMFVASRGCTLVQADYSQAELRTIAKLSGDENLLGIYRDSSRSLHRERAAAFYGENYDKEQYVKSKNMNFGITYQQSAFTFSQMYQLSEEEAQAYIDAWWRDFPKILDWVKAVQTQAQVEGEIVSPFGHKRRFHLLTKENLGDALREAVNFVPQNVAGVLTELAIVELVKRGVPIVTTVHDSIVADAPTDDVMDVAHEMKEVMESMPVVHLGWSKEDIPFLVEVAIGPNWADVKEIEL